MNAETTTIYMCAWYFSSICHNSLCHLFNYCSKFICLIELSHMSCTVETHPTEKTLLHQSLVCHPCYKVSCLMVKKVKNQYLIDRRRRRRRRRRRTDLICIYNWRAWDPLLYSAIQKCKLDTLLKQMHM